MNLRRRDLVNLGLATKVGAPVLLVADIDRGGVFASIVGTYCLLPADERAMIRSFAVNRFRGDGSLFTDGVRILEERTGSPCLGVLPMLQNVWLDEEDGVSLEGRGQSWRIAHCHCALSADLKRHRFPPAAGRALDRSARQRTIRPGDLAGNEEHDGGSRVDARVKGWTNG